MSKPARCLPPLMPLLLPLLRPSLLLLLLPLMLLLTLPLAACGSDGLDPDEVKSIPAGDATGSELSGGYRLTIVTERCSGQCPTFNVFGFWVRLCTPGHVDTETVTVAQTDGVLEVLDLGSSMYVNALKGGIYADGTFDVGGYEVQEGVEVGVAARVRGTVTTAGKITATATVFGQGEAEGKTIKCTGTYEVNGEPG